ncbi:MAG: DUF4097 family beta strand repeat-containing protein [Pyrinomonadaceae bacterium]
MMKPLPYILGLTLLVALPNYAQGQTAAAAGPTVAAKPDVTISLTGGKGRVSVRGWDRAEVEATSDNARRVELRRADEGRESEPAARVEVVLSPNDSGVDLNVPRGATVRLRVGGEVSVSGVAEVEVEAAGGDVYLRGITRATEVSSLGNTVVRDSTGRIFIRNVGGMVEVADVRPTGANENLQVTTVGGDCILERIGHTRLDVETITGNLTLIGAPAASARYQLRTTSGEVRVVMPADASFQINGRFGESGEFASEFPLKLQGGAESAGSRRVSGTHGSGDATLNLTSFDGSVRLRRKN